MLQKVEKLCELQQLCSLERGDRQGAQSPANCGRPTWSVPLLAGEEKHMLPFSFQNIVSAPHSQNQKAGNRVWKDAVPRLPAAEPAGKA